MIFNLPTLHSTLLWWYYLDKSIYNSILYLAYLFRWQIVQKIYMQLSYPWFYQHFFGHRDTKNLACLLSIGTNKTLVTFNDKKILMYICMMSLSVFLFMISENEDFLCPWICFGNCVFSGYKNILWRFHRSAGISRLWLMDF